MNASSFDEVFARLREEFPGWDITRAGGQWLATRDRVLTEVEMAYGLLHVLAAASAGRLRDALVEQRELAALHTSVLGADRGRS
jgi:hypothetical protein